MSQFLFLAGEGIPTAQLGGLLPIVLIFVVFYFFLIRPEKKRKKEVDNMRAGLKRGDKVTTIGGIVGNVVKVNDKNDLITIETGPDKVKLTFARWAIGTKEEKEKDKETTETVSETEETTQE